MTKRLSTSWKHGPQGGTKKESLANGQGRRKRIALGILLTWVLLFVRDSSAEIQSTADVGALEAFGEAARWRLLEFGARGDAEPSALAVSPQGEIAVGDSRGVSWRQSERDPADSEGAVPAGPIDFPHARRSTRSVLPPVSELVFDRRGQLWIATWEGLYRWSRSERPVRRSLRGGENGSRVHDLAISGNVLLVGSDAGAFWSSTGEIFQRLDFDGVGVAIEHVALRAGSEGASGSNEIAAGGVAEAWLFGNGRLIRVTGIVTPVGLRVLDRKRFDLPRADSGNPVVDLEIDAESARLGLAYLDAVATLDLSAISGTEGQNPSWELVRPTLAPGALIRSISWLENGLAVPTDHGLFVAHRPAGPYLRASAPVGTRHCIELRSGRPRGPRGAVLALCRAGLYALEQGGGRSAPAGQLSLRMGNSTDSSNAALGPDPPVEEIRRRALLRAGLDPSRSTALWSGLRNRAFWPELELRFGADFDEDDARDSDESFLSGEIRHLYDRSRDRGRRFDAAITLDWDLGGIAYPLESVDLSRELRQVVSLRDDVADEINQLYFERQRLRAAIARPGSLDAEEVARMRWRAREIDAGLDAWTGGWVARWRLDRERGGEGVRARDP